MILASALVAAVFACSSSSGGSSDAGTVDGGSSEAGSDGGSDVGSGSSSGGGGVDAGDGGPSCQVVKTCSEASAEPGSTEQLCTVGGGACVGQYYQVGTTIYPCSACNSCQTAQEQVATVCP